MMRILDAMREWWRPAAHDSGDSPGAWTPIYGGTEEGAYGEAMSFNVSAVWNAVRILSETVGQPPLITYEAIKIHGQDGRERATHHALYSLLHDQPNEFQTSLEWREQLMGHLVLRGNAYSRIIRSGGQIVELRPELPSSMTAKQDAETGLIFYEFRPDGGIGEAVTLPPGDVLHIRGFSWDGVHGISPLRQMMGSISMSKKTASFGRGLFDSDASARVIVSYPHSIKEDAELAVRERIKRGQRGTLVLDSGAKVEKWSFSPEEAQFLGTRQYEVNEFARWFNLPRHFLKEPESQPRANIEQESIEFIMFSMLPWFRRWEQALFRDLIKQKNKYSIEFLLSGFLRGDTSARYEAYSKGINSGVLTPGEARQFEGLNPLPNLDKPLRPVNLEVATKHAFERMADKAVNLETLKLGKIYERKIEHRHGAWAEFEDEAAKFYADHARRIEDDFGVQASICETFTSGRLREVLEAGKAQQRGFSASVPGLLGEWVKAGGAPLTKELIDELR